MRFAYSALRFSNLKKLISTKFGCAILAATLSSIACANVTTLSNSLAKNYPKLKITNLKPTEVTGLYSGHLDNQVIYVDEQGQHLMLGSMIRLKDQKNLTKDLVLGMNTINFNQLPLQDAIKTVKGTGLHKIAVFSDPNCPYCKTLEGNLSQLKNVTIYTFMYPIKAQSVESSKKVWCSFNKEYAWKSLIQQGIQPNVAATCANPIERNLQLGNRLGLQGTPAIIFSNGIKLTGAYSAAEIEKIWKELGI